MIYFSFLEATTICNWFLKSDRNAYTEKIPNNFQGRKNYYLKAISTKSGQDSVASYCPKCAHIIVKLSKLVFIVSQKLYVYK